MDSKEILMLITVVVAVCWYFLSHKNVVKNNTLEALKYTFDPEYQKGCQIIDQCYSDHSIHELLLNLADRETSIKFNAIMSVLDYHDQIAKGVNNKLYNGHIIKSQRYTSIMSIFSKTICFIYEYRKVYLCGDYCEALEKLCFKWRRKNIF